MFVPNRKACEILGVHPNTLRRWADEGKIECYVSEAGQRRYNVEKHLGKHTKLYGICYCRVSSYKQRDDLQRQVEFMQQQYPTYEIVKDIGSGLNFKRKGLNSLLGRVLDGDKLEIVVAHRDRLARFGFELIQYLIEYNGGKLVVLDKTAHSPEAELTEDLLTILHVFSCRMHGLRKYKIEIEGDSILPKL